MPKKHYSLEDMMEKIDEILKRLDTLEDLLGVEKEDDEGYDGGDEDVDKD